jgi:endo-1,4-beta-xylanase
VQANLQRFADAGFDIRITEMDVAIPDTGGTATLAAQGAVYRDILNACLNVSRCIELTTWGFSDRFNWVPTSFPGYGRALPFDSNYQPKAAVDSLLARLRRP